MFESLKLKIKNRKALREALLNHPQFQSAVASRTAPVGVFVIEHHVPVYDHDDFDSFVNGVMTVEMLHEFEHHFEPSTTESALIESTPSFIPEGGESGGGGTSGSWSDPAPDTVSASDYSDSSNNASDSGSDFGN